MAVLSASASRVPYSSTCTEWSMTSSAGASGLTRCGSPPSRAIASRMAARSTTHGTPVKSCMMTQEGLDICARDVHAVLAAQQVLEQDLERVRQPTEVVTRERGEAVVGVGAR